MQGEAARRTRLGDVWNFCGDRWKLLFPMALRILLFQVLAGLLYLAPFPFWVSIGVWQKEPQTPSAAGRLTNQPHTCT